MGYGTPDYLDGARMFAGLVERIDPSTWGGPGLGDCAAPLVSRHEGERHPARVGQTAVQDLEVGPHSVRWRHGSAPTQHAALEVRRRTVLLRPLSGWQHHIGECGRLGQHEIGDAEEVE